MLCKLVRHLRSFGRFRVTLEHVQLDYLVTNVGAINHRTQLIMATLDDLLANARAQDTRLDSVRALITDLRNELADILSGAKLPKDVQAKIDELFAQMEKNNAEITQALQPPGAPVEVPAQPDPAPANPPAENPAPGDRQA